MMLLKSWAMPAASCKHKTILQAAQKLYLASTILEAFLDTGIDIAGLA